MPYYSVLSVMPSSMDLLKGRRTRMTDLVTRHGGKYLARTTRHERLEGDGKFYEVMIIIEWPSREAAMSLISDPDYLPLLRARQAAAKSEHILIEGVDDIIN